MVAKRRESIPNKPNRKPATTPEGRENEMVSLATDLAEQQIRNGSASSQVITHFLKLGSPREVLERERLQHENELTRVKIEAIEAQQQIQELYTEALNAMRSYTGQPIDQDVDTDVKD